MYKQHENSNPAPAFVSFSLPLLLAAAALSGCGLPSNGHARLSVLGHAICRGEGGQPPLFTGRDRFDLYLDLLEHPKESVRVATTSKLRTNRSWGGPGHIYLKVADAYFDAGRGDALIDALWAAWYSATRDSEERYCIARAFVECRTLQYLRKNQEAAKEVGIKPRETPRRGWTGSLETDDLELLAPRIIEAGDDRFAKVWANHQRLFPGWLDRTLRRGD